MKIKVVYSEKIHSGFNTSRDKEILNIKRIIQMLEDDPWLERTIDKIRRRLKIGMRDYDKLISPNAMILEAVDLPDNSKFLAYIDFVCYEYFLPRQNWIISFYSLIKYNRMVFPVHSDGVQVFGGKELYNNIKKYPSWSLSNDWIYIQITRNIKKNRFLSLMKESYPQIHEAMKKLQSDEEPRVKLRSLKIYREMYGLKRQEGKSDADIADDINKNYDRALNNDEVRVMLNRYKEGIKKLHRNKLNR